MSETEAGAVHASTKLSPRARRAAAAAEAASAHRLHVMLKPGLEAEAGDAAVEKIADLVTDPQSIHRWRSGIVECLTAGSTLAPLAALEEVVWIDVDSTASIQELID